MEVSGDDSVVKAAQTREPKSRSLESLEMMAGHGSPPVTPVSDAGPGIHGATG